MVWHFIIKEELRISRLQLRLTDFVDSQTYPLYKQKPVLANTSEQIYPIGKVEESEFEKHTQDGPEEEDEEEKEEEDEEEEEEDEEEEEEDEEEEEEDEEEEEEEDEEEEEEDEEEEEEEDEEEEEEDEDDDNTDDGDAKRKKGMEVCNLKLSLP